MTVTEQLQRMIAASRTPPAELSISDKAAWELAGELALMQMMPAGTQSDFYEGLKQSGARVMGIPVIVADQGPDDPDAG